MKQIISWVFLMLTSGAMYGQELYVFSEPASNMPSKSIGARFSAKYPNTNNGKFTQRYVPEVMFGIDKNWMVHVSGSVSNYYHKNMEVDGGKLYVKYRFYSNDEVHKHFRMAAFADAGFSRHPYTYMDANLDGDNDGVQGGIIATQLINKLAISGTASYLKIFKPANKTGVNPSLAYNMLNYSLSTGYLLFPREYVDYKQTNLNLYVEMLGMKALGKNDYGLDLAPAVQLIFNSNSKVNIGYRFQVAGNMTRIAKQQLLVSLEHTFFNAWK
ncbi:MAG: hypothetical protein LH478_13525 [Chitinophagaceae bacterium]|nr:hypothetical protein [Chitinophagaceae bacterium]